MRKFTHAIGILLTATIVIAATNDQATNPPTKLQSIGTNANPLIPPPKQIGIVLHNVRVVSTPAGQMVVVSECEGELLRKLYPSTVIPRVEIPEL